VRGGRSRSPERTGITAAADSSTQLGLGLGGRGREEKENCSTHSPERGLNAPTAGSPDALKVAPDASGDHRTHAQRGLKFGISQDDGHRTLALASGALWHVR